MTDDPRIEAIMSETYAETGCVGDCLTNDFCRLVPVEPTEEMLKQGGKAVTKHMVLPADVRSAGVARAVAVYDAMLTAAPEIGDE